MERLHVLAVRGSIVATETLLEELRCGIPSMSNRGGTDASQIAERSKGLDKNARRMPQ